MSDSIVRCSQGESATNEQRDSAAKASEIVQTTKILGWTGMIFGNNDYLYYELFDVRNTA